MILSIDRSTAAVTRLPGLLSEDCGLGLNGRGQDGRDASGAEIERRTRRLVYGASPAREGDSDRWMGFLCCEEDSGCFSRIRERGEERYKRSTW